MNISIYTSDDLNNKTFKDGLEILLKEAQFFSII